MRLSNTLLLTALQKARKEVEARADTDEKKERQYNHRTADYSWRNQTVEVCGRVVGEALEWSPEPNLLIFVHFAEEVVELVYELGCKHVVFNAVTITKVQGAPPFLTKVCPAAVATRKKKTY